MQEDHIAPSPAQDVPRLLPLEFRIAKASDRASRLKEDTLELRLRQRQIRRMAAVTYKPTYSPYPTLDTLTVSGPFAPADGHAKRALMDVYSLSDASFACKRRTPD